MQSAPSLKKTITRATYTLYSETAKSRQHLRLHGSGPSSRKSPWYHPGAGGSSAQPFLDASDPPGQLHILREESNTAGMEGEEIGVLKEMY